MLKKNNYLDNPEIVIALIGAIGTDLELVSSSLIESLSRVNYSTEIIRFSQLLHEIDRWKNLPVTPEDKRYEKHMDAGNSFRQKIKRGDALALLAIGAIKEFRESKTEVPNSNPRRAYILRSLKNPKELHTLRNIYTPGFFVISAYSPLEKRLHNLASRIAESYHSPTSSEFLDRAQSLIKRDESDSDKEFGQNVRNTYPLADVFVDAGDPIGLKTSISRFIELVFANTFHTPNRDEYGLFHAQAAALRSASPGRQVGAVISTEEGDIISVGTNEVPKAGGGLYWSGDTPDNRDFNLGYDTSDKMKRTVLADLLDRLKRMGWLSKDKKEKNIPELVKEAMETGNSPLLNSSQLMNSIEFVRAVHAEMAAIVDASRRGVAVKGCVLYTTTFPCHDCAKHIVAAGIKRVVYIEPYPKSLTSELYPDSISVDNQGLGQDLVKFEPFVGISPRQYNNLFSMMERKEKNGKIIVWKESKANPRFDVASTTYIRIKEDEEFERFKKQITGKGLYKKNHKNVKKSKVLP